MSERAEFAWLLISLETAVPLHMAKIRDWPPWMRREYAQGSADEVACRGDTLMYGAKRGEAASVFSATARGLAVLACQPGGVTFAGVHWCASSHPFCPDLRDRPPCCGCGDDCRAGGGTCGEDCAWCRNGCVASWGQMCCTEKAKVPRRRPETAEVPGDVLLGAGGVVSGQQLERRIGSASSSNRFAEVGRDYCRANFAPLGEQDAATQQPDRCHQLGQVGARSGDRHVFKVHKRTVPNGLLVRQDAMYDRDMRTEARYAPGDEVFSKFQGMEAVGTVVKADDMTGFPASAPQMYTVAVEDGFGEEVEVIGYEDRMDLVRSADL